VISGMCTQTTQVTPETMADALGMMRSALTLLAGTDPHDLGTAELGAALESLGIVATMTSAVQAATLAAFDAAGGPQADGRPTAAAWLAARTGMSKSAARAAAKWSRTQTVHPRIAEAMKSQAITESFGKLIAGWTGKLPEHMRDGSDEILIQAAAGGCGQRELEIIAARLWAEYKQSQPDTDEPEDTFGDRGLYLDLTFGGAGRLRGDLSPQCAAALRAVLEALGKHRGADDDRTLAQRQHDALHEACQMLTGAQVLPDRAGAATRCETIIPFSALRDLPGASAIEDAWLAGDGYLTGADAEAACCDATLIPVVTGAPDWKIADQIIELALSAHGARRTGLSSEAAAALRMEIARLAIGFCSGPGAIASGLRTGLLGDVTGTVSLPLDVGYSETIPAHIRRAVRARDKHCRWPGCDATPARCECHHIIPKRLGGITALSNCVLLCWFHHQICIHRNGWVFTLHPDGTTQARSPDGTRILRSHSPPIAQAA
jgi:hypothetical protein